jgi:hypothetical protein
MKKVLGLLVSTLALASVGCGQSSNIVTDVRYQAYSDGQGNPITKVEFDLNTGGLLLPALTVPIANPHNPAQVYGSLSMGDRVGGGTLLSIEANLAAITQSGMSFDGCTLPNGHNLPLRLPAGIPCPIGIPLGSGGSELYLAFSDSVAMVGTAVVIREFDNFSGTIGGVDIFPGFRFRNGITGVAGLFTSTRPLQSGVAVFTDLTAVIPRVSAGSANRLALSVSSTAEPEPVSFAVDTTSSKTMQKVQKAMGKLKGQRLSSVD